MATTATATQTRKTSAKLRKPAKHRDSNALPKSTVVRQSEQSALIAQVVHSAKEELGMSAAEATRLAQQYIQEVEHYRQPGALRSALEKLRGR